MSQPRLLTAVLNYRTPELTLDAASAALREMEGTAGELIIVDNDSQDGSFERIAAVAEARGWTRGGRVRVLQSGRNGGFGAGNNVGIRRGLACGGKPDYVYILNSDALPDRGAIRALLAYLESNPQVGFAGSYIHGPDGTPHTTLFRCPSIFSEFETGIGFGPVTRLLERYVVPLPIPETAREVDWLAGASLMMRRSVLDEIGLFDEEFFLYFEETDLCRRARMAGWPTVYVPESRVTHIGSASTGMKTARRMPSYWFDSRRRYFTKHHGAAYLWAANAARVLGGLIYGARRLLQDKPAREPPRFLRDLVVHELVAEARRLRPSRLESPRSPVLPEARGPHRRPL